jgi:hypothetical protein
MPRAIIKIKDKYFEWSTVVDAPVTNGMTEAELLEYVKERHGSEGLRQLPERLARVRANGTSFHAYGNLDELLKLNRAGDGETCLTKDEIYAKYAKPPSNTN